MNREFPADKLFVPDGSPVPGALGRITHLGIGAHQDDLEFMAFHGIISCYESDQLWFGGVTCTNGAGSPRTGPYKDFSDERMAAVRHQEQKNAATIGRYAALFQLDHSSAAARDPADPSLENNLLEILTATRPQVVYTHNPADKHPTHVAVAVAALRAMRSLPPGQRPRHVIGCEVWRDLDWLPDDHKVLMDVSGHDALATALLGTFHSQIAAGKRYDAAILGRRTANATFLNPHATDDSTRIAFGLDLTPLVADESVDIAGYICAFIDQFKADVRNTLGAPPATR